MTELTSDVGTSRTVFANRERSRTTMNAEKRERRRTDNTKITQRNRYAMMDERRKSKQDRDAYEAQNKQITTKCNKAKEKWLNEQCDDIEKES